MLAHSGLTGTRGLREFRDAHMVHLKSGRRPAKAPPLPSERDASFAYGKPPGYRWGGRGWWKCLTCFHPPVRCHYTAFVPGAQRTIWLCAEMLVAACAPLRYCRSADDCRMAGPSDPPMRQLVQGGFTHDWVDANAARAAGESLPC